MKKLFSLLLLLCFVTPNQALPTFQESLSMTKITNLISIGVPISFSPVDGKDLSTRYLSSRKPLAFFSDPSLTASLSVNRSVSQWAADDIDIMASFTKSTLMGIFTEIDFIRQDKEDIDGQMFAVFEFTSKLSDETQESARVEGPAIRKYNYIQYTIHNNHTLIFAFSCPIEQRLKWEKQAREIMKSIKIKK